MEGKGCDSQRKRDRRVVLAAGCKVSPQPSHCCAQPCGANIQSHKAVRPLTHNPPPGIYPGNHSPRTPSHSTGAGGRPRVSLQIVSP